MGSGGVIGYASTPLRIQGKKPEYEFYNKLSEHHSRSACGVQQNNPLQESKPESPVI